MLSGDNRGCPDEVVRGRERKIDRNRDKTLVAAGARINHVPGSAPSVPGRLDINAGG